MNGMSDFEKELYHEIRQIRDKMERMEETMYSIKEDVAVGKVKHGTLSAVAGGLGGGLAVGTKLFVDWLLGGHRG